MYYQDHRCRGVLCWLPCGPPSLHSSGIWSGWSPPTVLCPLTKTKNKKKTWLFTPSVITSVGQNRVGTSVSLVNLSCLDANFFLGNTYTWLLTLCLLEKKLYWKWAKPITLRCSTMLFIINHLWVSKLVFYAQSEVRMLNPITQMKKEKGVGLNYTFWCFRVFCSSTFTGWNTSQFT